MANLEIMETDKLVDIVKNYKDYGYALSVRDHAMKVLQERGIVVDDLILYGQSGTKDYSRVLLKEYKKFSIIALSLYFITIIMNFVPYSESSILVFVIVFLVTYIGFVGFLIASAVAVVRFNKSIGKSENSADLLLYILVGLPLYIIVYFYFKGKMTSMLN